MIDVFARLKGELSHMFGNNQPNMNNLGSDRGEREIMGLSILDARLALLHWENGLLI